MRKKFALGIQGVTITLNNRAAHELFYDRFFKIFFCTDELALRVLHAGCTGMRFLDPAHLSRGAGGYRTLRGVEEDEWDPARKIFSGKLVREIP